MYNPERSSLSSTMQAECEQIQDFIQADSGTTRKTVENLGKTALKRLARS